MHGFTRNLFNFELTTKTKHPSWNATVVLFAFLANPITAKPIFLGHP